jgi:hypothetical protein
MDSLEHFHITEDCAFFRPVGQASFQQAVHLVTTAITFARERRVRRLLVSTLQLTGIAVPTVTDRYYMAQEWADAAMGTVKLALVTRPELIDPEKFGMTVAYNMGLRANVFSSEEEALIWLLDDKSGDIRAGCR